jgi:hypothetical protein
MPSGSKRLCSESEIPSMEATRSAVLQALLEAGADGTRTRDLRRDRCAESVSAGFAEPLRPLDHAVFGKFAEPHLSPGCTRSFPSGFQRVAASSASLPPLTTALRLLPARNRDFWPEQPEVARRHPQRAVQRQTHGIDAAITARVSPRQGRGRGRSIVPLPRATSAVVQGEARPGQSRHAVGART